MLHHPSRYRRAALGLASMGAGMALLVGVLPGSAGADGGDKEVVDGNPKCTDLGYANGFKIDVGGEYPAAGTYAAGDPGTETEGDADDFEVTIDYASTDPIDVGFEANTAVDAVFVKAGPGGFLYTYDPPVTAGSGLGSPKDSISHITFCWDGGDTPPGNGTTTTITVPDEGDEDGEDDGDEGDEGEDTPPGKAPGATGVTAQPNFTG